MSPAIVEHIAPVLILLLPLQRLQFAFDLDLIGPVWVALCQSGDVCSLRVLLAHRAELVPRIPLGASNHAQSECTRTHSGTDRRTVMRTIEGGESEPTEESTSSDTALRCAALSWLSSPFQLRGPSARSAIGQLRRMWRRGRRTAAAQCGEPMQRGPIAAISRRSVPASLCL